MNFQKNSCVIFFLSLFLCLKGYCTEITLFADPSFIGEVEESANGKLAGLGGEIIAKAFKAKNIKINLEWRPWARAYKEALDNKDKKSFIIPLTRIPEREEKFIWASKIYSAHAVFITMKKGKRIDSFLEAKNATIGVLTSSSYRAMLVRPENGLDVDKISENPIDIRNFKKLIGKRIDTWFTIDIVASYAIDILAKDENLTQKDFVIGNPVAIQEKYIGTTSETPPELISKVQDAVESFKQTQEYKKLIGLIKKTGKDSFKK
ncbi:substrate-binding periplasmic protein [Fluviispira sanaruensis]|uniref:substrate-binding periplasmic protein n=1 Tax=Fluviispira sanaruensis TaxID=2493639 RepID=UPI00102E56B8|nr:transporter substrate-binding domain-containing protein [Fluviispira sanaruensis]